MKTALFIIAQQGFRDEELKIPYDVLSSAGIKCIVASITRDMAVGKLGAQVNPDMAVSEANINEIDVVIVVGGPGAPELASYNEVIDLLRLAKESGKVLAAICVAPTILARAGVIGGKKVTVFFTPENKLSVENGGATYVSENVVVDENLVTANNHEAAVEFGKAIVEILKE